MQIKIGFLQAKHVSQVERRSIKTGYVFCKGEP